MSRVFVDTNLLVYQFDAGEPEKQTAARRLLTDSEHTFVISTQVLLELYVVITRRLQPSVSLEAAQRVITTLSRLPVVPADARLVLRAVTTSAHHQLSIWDAMIVEAAAEAACDEIWSEDLAPGTKLRGVVISNPLVERR